MNKKAKIAVVGDQDSIMVFKALGFQTFYATEQKEIESTIHQLARDDYSLIYITEESAALAADTVALYKTSTFPVIIPIPGRNGSQGFGMKGIQDNIEKAIGADIL